MSTLQKTIKVDGVLTDPTSVKLSDAAAAFGVKRNDTGAVVVADDTAMTKKSTGIYTHTFTDPAYGLTYTYSLELVYLGETYHLEGTLVGPTTPDYCVRADIESLFGVNNVAKWADLDSDADATKITNRIDKAIVAAANMIDEALWYSRYLIPIAKSGVTPTSIRDLCATLAGVWLYEARGTIDFDAETGRVQHAYQFQRDGAAMQLKNYNAGTKVIDADLKTQVSGQLYTAPTVIPVELDT